MSNPNPSFDPGRIQGFQTVGNFVTNEHSRTAITVSNYFGMSGVHLEKA